LSCDGLNLVGGGRYFHQIILSKLLSVHHRPAQKTLESNLND